MSHPTGQTTLATLSEAGRAEAHRRWLVLRPHLEDGVPLTHVATPRMIDKELTQLASAFVIIRTPDQFDPRTRASTHALAPFVELLISTRQTGSTPRPWSSSASPRSLCSWSSAEPAL